MNTLLKLSAYICVTASVGVALTLFAWGISYGMTGYPTFYENGMLVTVAVALFAALAGTAFALFENEPWV